MTTSSATFLGIDLGSTGCRLALQREGRIQAVPSLPDRPGLPNPMDAWIVRTPEWTDTVVPTRFVGLRDALGLEFAHDLTGRQVRPEEVLTQLLGDIRKGLSPAPGEGIGNTCVALPPGLPAPEWDAVLRCFGAAGFHPVAAVGDTTAAALGAAGGSADGATVLVCSCGYSGFEAALIRVVKGRCRVIGSEHAELLSGAALDRLLMRTVVLGLRQQVNLDLRCGQFDADQWRLFHAGAQAARERLGTQAQVEWVLPVALTRLPEPVRVTLERSAFIALFRPILEENLDLVRKLLEDTGMAPSDVDDAVLIGGTNHLPELASLLAGILQREPRRPPVDLLACGAALQASRPEEAAGGESARAAAPPGDSRSVARRLAQAGLLTPKAGLLEAVLRIDASPAVLQLLKEAPRSTGSPVERPDSGRLFRYVQHLIDSGQLGRARAYLTNLVDEAQAYLGTIPKASGSEGAQAWIDRAFRYLEGGNLLQAVHASHMAHSRAGDQKGILDAVLEIHRCAAMALAEPEKWDLSIQWLSCALVHDPADPQTRQALAERLSQQAAALKGRGKPKEALALLDQALALDPDHPVARALFAELRPTR